MLGEELGYGSVCCVEPHFTRGFSHASAPDLFLAAIAIAMFRFSARLPIAKFFAYSSALIAVLATAGSLRVKSTVRTPPEMSRGLAAPVSV